MLTSIRPVSVHGMMILAAVQGLKLSAVTSDIAVMFPGSDVVAFLPFIGNVYP